MGTSIHTKKQKLYELMAKNPDMCGDDTHAAVAKIIQVMFGPQVPITKMLIKEIVGLDRARRKVLEEHPEIDLRVATLKGAEIETAHREYYGGRV